MEEQKDNTTGMAIGNAVANVADTALGLLMRKANDRRQLRQQQKLNDQQVAAQKEMGKYNQGLALDTWNKTNYAAQVEQLKKAGLNTGLMYDGGGAGGTTQTPTGSVTAGTAPIGGHELDKGMGLLQTQMAQAQIKNLNASTEATNAMKGKTEAETTKISGVDTQESGSRIANIGQQTKNAQVQEELLNYETAMKALELKVNSGTANERVKNAELANNQIMSLTRKTIEETRSAMARANVDQATQDEAVKQIELNTIEKTLSIELQKVGIKAGNEGITKMATEVYNMMQQTNQGERRLNQEQQKILLQQLETEFKYGAEAGAIRWLDALSDIIPTKTRIK